MRPQTKSLLALAVIALIGGYALGRYARPAKVVTKTEIVTKTVTVDHVDTVTIVKEITKPDGTKETDTTVTDKSTIDSQNSTTLNQSQTVDNTKPQWRVLALVSPSNTPVSPLYGVGVERRILGPVWAGIQGNTDKVVALTVGLEF